MPCPAAGSWFAVGPGLVAGPGRSLPELRRPARCRNATRCFQPLTIGRRLRAWPAQWQLAPLASWRQRRRHAPVLLRAAPPSGCGALLQEGWPLWTAFAVCGALGQVVERRTPLGAVLSAPLVSMLLALAAAALGLVPASSGAADAIWAYLMPLGAALCLLESDLTQLLTSAGPTLAAFVLGALGTVLGTVVAFQLVGPRLGPEGYKVAAALCASYIGGSVNFAAVSQAFGLAGPVLAGAMAADNCVMALYIATIMSIPAEEQAGTGARQADSSAAAAVPGSSAPAATAESIALSIAAAALACTLGNHIAAAVGLGSSGLAVMALVASGIAMAASKLAAFFSSKASSSHALAAAGAGAGQGLGSSTAAQQQHQAAGPFAGAEALGGAAMMIFFATIGAAAGSLQALQGCGWLVLFILLQLSIHLAVCLAGGKLLRLPMQAILIASNANVGGPATAAAMASSKGWQHMVQPAMLTGSLGYAVANGIGLCMGQWLSTWHVL